jgi:anti-sigma regulatory factor (Ser/Thr protein kinase)
MRPGGLRDLRSWARAWLAQHRAEVDPDVVALVMTEMVTNSVRHGTAPVDVELVDNAGHLLLTVTDGSTDPPQRLAPSPGSEAGRGTVILDALTASWGFRLEPHGGKTVWCEFDA